eukprot:766204-Hanusia_phi.AAC.2
MQQSALEERGEASCEATILIKLIGNILISSFMGLLNNGAGPGHRSRIRVVQAVSSRAWYASLFATPATPQLDLNP